MKIKEVFICVECGMEFESMKECIEHEKLCIKTHTFKCDKCGKKIDYTNHSDCGDYKLIINKQECWNIDLGKPGYGSKFDQCHVKFNLCDDCLYDFIHTLQPRKIEQIFKTH